MRCEQCKHFAKREGEKLPMPAKPKPVKSWGIYFGPSQAKWRHYVMWALAVANHNKLLEFGNCSRFPAHVMRHHADTCGEFSPKEDQ